MMSTNLLLIILVLLPASLAKYLELCCQFQDRHQNDVAQLSDMFDSFNFKLLMGCSIKPPAPCTCFDPGCSKVSVTILDRSIGSRESYQIPNGPPSTLFHGIMRTILPPQRPHKDTYHVYVCKNQIMTPYLWGLVANGQTTYSLRKRCLSPEVTAEVQLSENTLLGVLSFERAIQYMLYHHVDEMMGGEYPVDTVDIKLAAASKWYYKQIKHSIESEGIFNVKQRLPDENIKLHREEILLDYKGCLCRTYDYGACLRVIYLMLEGDTIQHFHLPVKLLDLFLTTAPTPAVLVIYTSSDFIQTQATIADLESSLSQTTLGNYSIAMMEQSGDFRSGSYYMLSPNNLKECDKTLHNCVSAHLGVYLPPSRTSNKLVDTVFGEQFIGDEDVHRGNLNNPSMFEPTPAMERLVVIRELLLKSDYAPNLSPSLTVLNSQSYRDLVAATSGTFVLFVFRSDLESLHTLQQLMETDISNVKIIECFDLNIICNELGITTYPSVFYVRNGTTVRYTGPLIQATLDAYMTLVQYPVVTTAQRLQIDVVLKGAQKAVVLISSNLTILEHFRGACGTLHGFIQCFHLPHSSENMMIIHVPGDPLMTNKNIHLNKLPSFFGSRDNDVTVTFSEKLHHVITKLSTHSVISETSLLTIYRDFKQFLLFDGTVDNELAALVNAFPAVQFVQITSKSFKYELLRELIGFDYENVVMLICKEKGVGYRYPGGGIEVWLGEVLAGSRYSDFRLRDLEQSKYQYRNIYYKQHFAQMRGHVLELRAKVDKLNSELIHAAESHYEL